MTPPPSTADRRAPPEKETRLGLARETMERIRLEAILGRIQKCRDQEKNQ